VYIKNLELYGFKTFQQKTVINFPLGISSVVGPNGCGKSNIIDAIRWVMGEQNPRMLRGQSMDDIIFNGGAKYKSQGMAEVNLLLNNEDGNSSVLFKDIPEIRITRRLFRSGESQYMINKRPCRMKDITILFMDSGGSHRAHNIIEQGKIMQMVEARPEERRIFIEEAAGIAKFKFKKKESLAQLAKANENLSRLNDLIFEVERTFKGLARQANKAKKYSNFLNELVELDKTIAIYSLHNLNVEEKMLRKALSELNEDIEKNNSLLRQYELVKQKIEMEMLKNQGMFQTAQEKLFKCQTELEKMETNVEHNNQEIYRLGKNRPEIEEKLIREKDKIEKSKARFLLVTDRIDNGALNIKNLEKQIKVTSDKTESLRIEFTCLQDEINEKKSEIVELLSKSANCNNNIVQLNRELEKLNNNFKRLSGEIEQGRQRSEIIKKDLYRLSEAVTKNQSLKSELETKIDKSKNIMDGSRATLKNLYKERDICTISLEKESVKLSTLEKIQMSELSNMSKFSINNNETQVLAQLIDVEKGYEKAVASALGLHLRAVPLKIKDYPDIFFKLKAKDKKNPINFILLRDSYHKTDIDNTVQLACLKNFVRGNDELKPFLDYYLGDILLSDTLEQAVTVWDDMKHPVKIVTKDGEYISDTGFLATGLIQERDALFMERKREIEELLIKKSRHEEELKILEKKIKEIQEIFNKEKRELEVYEDNLKKISKAIIEDERNILSLSEEQKHLLNRQSVVEFEINDIENNKQNINNEINTQKEEMALIVKQNKEKDDLLMMLECERDKFHDSINKVEKDYNKFVLQYNTEETELKNNQKELKQLDSYMEESLIIKEEFEKNLNELDSRIIEINKRLEDLRIEIQNKEEIRLELKSGIKAVGDLQENQTKDIHEIQGRITSQRDKLKEFENKYMKLEQKNEVNRLQKGNLGNNLWERHHIELSEIYEQNIKTIPEDFDLTMLAEQQEKIKHQLEIIGPVNMEATEEEKEHKERLDLLKNQENDLLTAEKNLRSAIKKLDNESKERFISTMEQINEKLKDIAPLLFGEGGTAELFLTEDDPLTAGVEFKVKPSGKKITAMSLLSGGEKALSAISMLFAIYFTRPAPFCILDEADSPLDEANIERFIKLLELVGENAQIIMATHNKRLMEFSETLFGVTMDDPGVSKIISVNINDYIST